VTPASLRGGLPAEAPATTSAHFSIGMDWGVAILRTTNRFAGDRIIA
jgi:hypothetical protein